MVEKVEWLLAFDGSATHQSGGAGVILQNDDGTVVSVSFRLDFPYSNNVAEYDALVIGLVYAYKREFEEFKYRETPSSSYNRSTESFL